MPAAHALIVGAGIGGLSAALALGRQGWTVTLLEQAEAPSEVGAGIQLSPNATRVLAALGVLPALASVGFQPQALEMRSARSGRLLLQAALGTQAEQRYGAPYLHIHRADLHRVLLDAVQALPQVRCVFGSRVSRLQQDADGVSVVGEDGRDWQADLLIGADGIHSAVRAALFGAEQARFTGCVAWRGIIPVERLQGARPAPVAALWLGPGAHFVHYYVRGGQAVNFVAVSDRDDWQLESWTQRGEHRELLAEFGDWQEPVRRLVQAADPQACFKWALFDRPPMPRWSRGRITLLGDACHATLPFMAQGAAMAIEDAAVLASRLRGANTIAMALRAYEEARRERTAAIQNGSRQNKTLYHLRGPAAWVRDQMTPAMQLAFTRRLDTVFAYQAV